MSKLRYLRLKYLIRLPYFLFKKVFVQLPFMHFIRNTRYTQTPISFITWWRQKVLGYNRDPYWPIHFTSTFGGDWRNVYCGIETCPGFSPGNYIQAQGKIYIGDYTQIAPNVGIISANHQLEDNRLHDVKDVVIGKYCWIGMGAVILPGVTLGDYTIVAANATVTKSFPEGYCVIGGVPAKVIKTLDKEKCVHHRSQQEYNGYIPSAKFEDFRKKHLNL